MVTDHRKLPRRRGKALSSAIYQATLEELANVGYAKLTMERVAERAKAGKASLYRRWPTRIELVMDAVYHALPNATSIPDTGSLREDAMLLLRRIADLLEGPSGEALRGLLSEALGDRSQAATFREHTQSLGTRMMREIVARAIERGEVAPEAMTPRRLEAGQALLRQHFLFNGLPIPDELINGIVDEVIVPLFVTA